MTGRSEHTSNGVAVLPERPPLPTKEVTMMINRRQFGVVTAFAAVTAVFVSPRPVSAGHYRLEAAPAAGISVRLVDSPSGLCLEGIVNPAFGPGTPGRGELRLLGTPVVRWTESPHTFLLAVDPAGKGVERLDKPGGRIRVKPGLKYGLEAVVWEKARRRPKWASATAEFALVAEVEIEPAAVPAPAPAAEPAKPGIVEVSETELKRLVEEAYKAGLAAGKAAAPVAPPAPKPEAERPKVEESKPAPTPTGRVVLRARGMDGKPAASGIFLVIHPGGQTRVEWPRDRLAGSGWVVLEVPAGHVSLRVRTEPGFRWTLAKGQKPEAELRPGGLVRWDLRKEVKR